jgi:ribosomal protein S18 acetylase RimI-like enzyme
MELRYLAVDTFGLEPTAALANRGFSDYFVPVSLTAASILAMVRQDSVDPTASRVVLLDDQPAGVAFIARRGWTSRLAAMAVVPEARRRGVGEGCVRHLLAEARARGERAMTLEVIEQNDGAARLYTRCGFGRHDRLVGYEGRPVVAAAEPTVAVDIRDVSRALIAHGPPDLPWQLSGETLAQAAPPAAAYRNEHAWVAISDPAAPTVTVRAIVTVPHARRRGVASALLGAVVAQHPGRTWRVGPIWPEALGGLFERLGLRRSSLTQLQMTIALGSDGGAAR